MGKSEVFPAGNDLTLSQEMATKKHPSDTYNQVNAATFDNVFAKMGIVTVYDERGACITLRFTELRYTPIR